MKIWVITIEKKKKEKIDQNFECEQKILKKGYKIPNNINQKIRKIQKWGQKYQKKKEKFI